MFTLKDEQDAIPFALIDNKTPLFFKKTRGVNREFNSGNGKLELMPTVTDDRDSIYIAGPTGSGKTRFAMNYLKNYKEIFPDNRVIIFTSKPKDDTINSYDFDFNIMNIDNLSFEEDPIQIDEVEDSAIFFDDVDYFEDRIKKQVKDFIKKCIGIGREFRVTTIVTSHLIKNYSNTKFVISDCKYCVFYPNSGIKYGIKNFLLKEMGMSSPQIDHFFEKDSTWIVCHTRSPQFIMWENGAEML